MTRAADPKSATALAAKPIAAGATGAGKPGATAIPPDDLIRLIELRHPNPHGILGAHPRRRGGVVVRAFRPGAESVAVIVDGDGETARLMRMIDAAGLFEVLIADRREVFPYRLRVTYPGRAAVTIYDPYAFLPTVGDLDLHLWNEGRHERIYEKLGAHPLAMVGVAGVAFAVWAPNARGVSVIGEFNEWDGRVHAMRMLGSSGVWEIFIPELAVGALYKYEVRARDGGLVLKADPFANAAQIAPQTASIIDRSTYRFEDAAWMETRGQRETARSPLSIYEVHLGSWRRVAAEDHRSLSYRELAPILADYVCDMGFTHVEMLPVMEHPFEGSWGYQVTGYFAPNARWGTPDEFRYLVDHLHQRGIGVILDWVPAHFPTDQFALGRFDGTALYEHLDARKGFHPDWDTYIFNYGRNEVRNFLIASALYWLSEFHADGLRVDAVASMLYLDYARRAGEWIPNQYGERENLEAVEFIKALNRVAYANHPGIMMIAEESTSWPAVSRPIYLGGLGFGLKWDMGWMHDTLNYFSRDPIHRRFHHRDVTFGFLYAWTENFVLPLSHDEVVHGKGAMLSRMPGDRWQQFANLRALYGYMWARPGKKMIFMGGEFGQWREWNHDESLDWHLLQYDEHRALQTLVRELNRVYLAEPALWQADSDTAGFRFLDADNADDNVIAFMRIAPQSGRRIICVCNFSPVVREGYRVGVPVGGVYREILNTDAAAFGGSDVGNAGAIAAEATPYHGLDYSIAMILPPLGVIWLEVPRL
ncbi:MAG: 1,4-alpha-glucan branching protein GlgB [Candidatus Binataceae bacterium]|nr:1,4-alpha-glucan branching protein GlgB [Candidatus Binataceae bacterium]